MPELWTVRSAQLDPAKKMLHRKAAKFQPEPMIAGQRLGLRRPITLTEEQVDINHKLLEDLVKSGSISIFAPDGSCQDGLILADDAYRRGLQNAEAADPALAASNRQAEKEMAAEAIEVEKEEAKEAAAAASEAPPAITSEEIVPVAPPEKPPEISSAGPAPLNIEESAQGKGKHQKRR